MESMHSFQNLLVLIILLLSITIIHFYIIYTITFGINNEYILTVLRFLLFK